MTTAAVSAYEPARFAALDTVFDAAVSRLDKRVVVKTGVDIDDAWTEYATRDQLAGLSLHTLSYLLCTMEKRNASSVRWPGITLGVHCWGFMRASYHSEAFCPRCGFVQNTGPAVG